MQLLIFPVRLFLGLMFYASSAVVLTFLWIPLLIRTLISEGPRGLLSLFRKENVPVPEVSHQDGKHKHEYVRTESGLKFHYVHSGPEDAPLMLCLHGFPECWYSWRHVLEQFSDDYHVVAIDLRGYGESDKPEGVSAYHVDHLANDTREIIESLGYDQATVVGHDWGGIIAWQTARCFPYVVKNVIILNAPGLNGFRDFLIDHPWQLITNFWYIIAFQLPYAGEFLIAQKNYEYFAQVFNGTEMGMLNKEMRLSDEQLLLYKYSAGRHATSILNFYRALNPLYTGLGLKQVTDEVVQPTLLIWSKDDAVLDVGMVPYIEKYMTNVDIEVMDGSHWVGQDNPQGVFRAMKTFLKKQPNY